jgi:importin-5
LIRESHTTPVLSLDTPLTHPRSNPAIPPRASQIFTQIVLALEAETLQGQTARKVAEAAKKLVSQNPSAINADAVLSSLTPEGQATVKSYFE